MKKITRLLLLAAISIGMVACSNDDVPQTPESLRGSTYASIAVTLPKAPSTRALPEDYNKLLDWEGIDAIETITVFLVNETLGTIDHSTFGTSQFKSIKDGVLQPNLAVKGTPGEAVKAYVVLNGNSDVLTTLKGTTPGAFAGVYATAVSEIASNLAENKLVEGKNKDVIMMTNTVLPTAITIAPNVTKEKAISGEGNKVEVKVERVVSRAIVTAKAAAKTSTIAVKDAMDNDVSTITIKSVDYVVGQSNKEFFLTKNTGWKTPAAVYNHVPGEGTTVWDPILFDNTGLAVAERSTVLDATGAAALADFNTALTTELADSKFVLPVTHEDANYRKGNTTFFEVIAIFTPNLVDGAKYTAGADVFLGMNDGLFYSTRALAEASGQKATHYKGDGTTGAIMKYVLWLNPDVIPGTAGSKAKLSPTVRNQVYHAHIKGFKSIGVPNNPINPDDPNNPQPKDPTDPGYDPTDPWKPKDPTDPGYDPNNPGNENPKNPIDPKDPLETEDTYLSVEITVLKWGVHSYEIDLGNDY